MGRGAAGPRAAVAARRSRPVVSGPRLAACRRSAARLGRGEAPSLEAGVRAGGDARRALPRRTRRGGLVHAAEAPPPRLAGQRLLDERPPRCREHGRPRWLPPRPAPRGLTATRGPAPTVRPCPGDCPRDNTR